MFKDVKSRVPFAAFSGFLFLAFLTLIPIFGGAIIHEGFGDRDKAFLINQGTVERTDNAIKLRFAELFANRTDKRAAWSQAVSDQIDLGRMSAARGLLIAAPSILSQTDSSSLMALIHEGGKSGDDAYVTAALRYLHEPVRDAFERVVQADHAMLVETIESNQTNEAETPPIVRSTAEIAAIKQLLESESVDVATEGTVAENGEISGPRQEDAGAEDANPTVNFLGSERDLALTASKWLRNEQIDEISFFLSGIGLTALQGQAEAQTGASVLRSALRARRLNPQLETYLSGRLHSVVPPASLRRTLATRMAGALATTRQGNEVKEAFLGSTNARALERLEKDLILIEDMASSTSPIDAITMLELTRGYTDLNRARLVTRAGGQRAIALARLDPEGVLYTAQLQVNWTPQLRLMLTCASIMGAGLILIAFGTLFRSLMRAGPRRRNTLYALDNRN